MNGIAQQARVSAPPTASYAVAPPPGSPLPAPGFAAAPKVSPSYPAPRSGVEDTSRRTLLLGGVSAAVIGVAVGVLVASGALNGGHTSTITQISKPPSAAAQSPGAARARGSVLHVLGRYTRAYSSRDLGGLAAIFTSGVKRHGLAAGGCHVVHGRGAVLRDYESQFNEGTGAYRLVGLSSRSVALAGTTVAHVHTHYAISTGGAGFVNFALQQTAAGWKISEVFATCA